MTPGARIAAAIDVIDAILAGASPEQVLKSWARASRFAGSKTGPRSGITSLMCCVPSGRWRPVGVP
uniref:Uncharacterized protein n=1 Tax=Yoonia rhodophyticola TaxID=3137370 RepID=A0AAN0NL90_9RHOB